MKVKVRKMKMILKIVKMKMILKIVKTKMTTIVNMKMIRIVKMRKTTTTKKKAMEAPLVKAIRGILFLKIPVRKMKMMWMINLKKNRSF